MPERPFRLGLTGSIGMGKSTTAALFADEGVAVWDADAAVHRLYASGGDGAAAIAGLAPEAVAGGAVDRAKLAAAIAARPWLLDEIEAAVHPLVRADRQRFLEATAADIALLDIPLLYETGSETDLDAVVVVSAPAALQRARVLERPGMTEERLDHILSRQLADAEKRRRADYVIDTSQGVEDARRQVQAVLKAIREASDA